MAGEFANDQFGVTNCGDVHFLNKADQLAQTGKNLNLGINSQATWVFTLSSNCSCSTVKQI